MTSPANSQRITNLTPLSQVRATLERIAAPVSPIDLALRKSAGFVLAQPLVSPRAFPSAPTAIRDGWAVRADDLSDASAYTPVALPKAPQRIDAGEALPPVTNAVVPFEAIQLDGTIAHAVAPAADGDGVLAAGEDASEGTLLRAEGKCIRPLDIALATRLGVESASVRAPHIVLVRSGNTPLRAELDFFSDAVAAAGGRAEVRERFEAVLTKPDADAVIAIGGTGFGKNDNAVLALAKHGAVIHHGLAISPGETAAFGRVGKTPVLILPGQFDGAFSAWLLVGSVLIAMLSVCSQRTITRTGLLTRKVSSAIGLSGVVLVKETKGGLEPIASSYLSIAALAQADGWILVPPESEGFASGTSVEMTPLD